jgi:hypothetical protein
MKGNALLRVVVCLSLLVVAGCTKSEDETSNGDPRAFTSDCGTVQTNAVVNPIEAKIAERGAVTPVSPNLVLMGKSIIKLHAINAATSNNKIKAALDLMGRLAAQGDAYVFRAAPGCTATISGGEQEEGIVGQVFSADGTNFSEALLKAGLATADTSDVCKGFLIGSCYQALQRGDAGRGSSGGGSSVTGEITKFLWKPVSDSDGRLAVHVTPAGTVVVNGETGTMKGPGNGYAELGRFSKTGCGYGAGASVQILDREGVPLTLNGSDTITIPNGCNRYCLEGGQIVQCVKR